MPVARIHLGILCDWWMNKRRLRPPQNKKIWWSTFVVAKSVWGRVARLVEWKNISAIANFSQVILTNLVSNRYRLRRN
ncbi:hypothetical protein [Nostoc sp.]|uniref:hypothetical protein n=1 Tax=Nostoc sp. TaxID=1180 RepID=UPI002FF51488